jgi:DNA invertase Pin-like site-specific DNA recombinase
MESANGADSAANFVSSGVYYGYLRVSSAEQSRFSKGHVSLEAQRAAATAFMRQKGWHGTMHWITEVRSARSMENQTQLRRVIRRLNAGDRVLVYDVTRFARSARDGLNALFDAYKKSAEVWSCSDGIQYRGTAGKNIFTLHLSFAEHESNKISDRTKAALAYCRARGDFLGRDAPFGKRAVRLPNGTALRALKRRWDRFEGTYSKFANELNESGSLNRNRAWNARSIEKALEGANINVGTMRDALNEVTPRGRRGVPTRAAHRVVIPDDESDDDAVELPVVRPATVPRAPTYPSVIPRRQTLASDDSDDE